MFLKIDFTEKEINQLYDLSIECKHNCLSKKQLIVKINNLRSGGFVDVIAGLAFINSMILQANNVNGFQRNLNVTAIPHLQFLYGNQPPRNHFGNGKNAGSKSIIVTVPTQNALSEKKSIFWFMGV